MKTTVRKRLADLEKALSRKKKQISLYEAEGVFWTVDRSTAGIDYRLALYPIPPDPRCTIITAEQAHALEKAGVLLVRWVGAE